METLYTVLIILACVLLFSFAVFIHEFGHFVAARLLGLRVDSFSIGFGPALWKKKIGDVEYRISLIPCGGYVMLPELDPEGTEKLQGGSDKDNGRPLKELPAWKRIVVAFAGPFGNIVLAVVLAVVLSCASGARFGEIPPVVATATAAAAEAGLRSGDRVLSVNGHPVRTWNDVCTEVQIAHGQPADFVVQRDGAETALKVPGRLVEGRDAYVLDAQPSILKSRVDELVAGGGAEKAGLQLGDMVTRVDGVAVGTLPEIHAVMDRHGAGEVEVGVTRGGTNLVLKIVATADAETGRALLGFKTGSSEAVAAPWMPSRGAIDQLRWDAGQIFRVLKGLVSRKESKNVAKSLGGPVMIAQVLYKQARHNFWDAIGFLRFLNVNLAVLNLLPIPVLDGGLIFFALIELLTRRKLPKKLVNGLSMVFMWLFLALMVFLAFRDVSRIRADRPAAGAGTEQPFEPAFNLHPDKLR